MIGFLIACLVAVVVVWVARLVIEQLGLPAPVKQIALLIVGLIVLLLLFQRLGGVL